MKSVNSLNKQNVIRINRIIYTLTVIYTYISSQELPPLHNQSITKKTLCVYRYHILWLIEYVSYVVCYITYFLTTGRAYTLFNITNYKFYCFELNISGRNKKNKNLIFSKNFLLYSCTYILRAIYFNVFLSLGISQEEEFALNYMPLQDILIKNFDCRISEIINMIGKKSGRVPFEKMCVCSCNI